MTAEVHLTSYLDHRGTEARPLEHSEHDVPTLREHLRLLRAAGFAAAGTVWQHGLDRVLVAVR